MKQKKNNEKVLSSEEKLELLKVLKARFEKHKNRHKGIDWDSVLARLESFPFKLFSIHEMENSGGEPDVVSQNKKTGVIQFMDCAEESPKGRRSVCYDQEGLDSRKEFKPDNNAMDMAANMGAEMLTEDQYRQLQQLGEFDNKTSSWVKTPPEIRKLGGELFMDRRYGTLFLYHNSAPSYYAARGFRVVLEV